MVAIHGGGLQKVSGWRPPLRRRVDEDGMPVVAATDGVVRWSVLQRGAARWSESGAVQHRGRGLTKECTHGFAHAHRN